MAFLRSASHLAWGSLLVFTPLAALAWGWRAGVGFACGVLWSLANVWIITSLTRPLVHPHRMPIWNTAGLWVVKVPVLYAVGAMLILSPWSSGLAFLAGFSWWFVLLIVSAMRAIKGPRHGLV